jgi:hypothetical protein
MLFLLRLGFLLETDSQAAFFHDSVSGIELFIVFAFLKPTQTNSDLLGIGPNEEEVRGFHSRLFIGQLCEFIPSLHFTGFPCAILVQLYTMGLDMYRILYVTGATTIVRGWP